MSPKIFLEAASSLLLMGSLAQNTALLQVGQNAINQLVERGFQKFGTDEPIRVYPLSSKAGDLHKLHGGTWSPGVISLRADPQAEFSAQVYLRHELMHEATYRTCGNKAPVWVSEAASIAFSGEANDAPHPSETALDRLREAVRSDASLNSDAYAALRALISQYGWPERPCAVSEQIAGLVTSSEPLARTPLSYIVISLLSGRTLEYSGDLKSQTPLGSLLKIPYAAALDDSGLAGLSQDLLKSDTKSLLERRQAFRADLFQVLMSTLPEQKRLSAHSEDTNEIWGQLLGDRNQDGSFPLELSLTEAARLLRVAWLMTPERFQDLRQNGTFPGSTLSNIRDMDKAFLHDLDSMAKTGTISNQSGAPLLGLLAFAWPSRSPQYLAVIRKGGVRGAEIPYYARSQIQKWHAKFPPEKREVRVKLLSLLTPDKFSIESPCPEFQTSLQTVGRLRANTCGFFNVVTLAPGAMSHRVVRGLLEQDTSGPILITDTESYADGVLRSEADSIRGEARAALRAVIVWDGIHGTSRHPETHSLCDSTHCMVFQGAPDSRKANEQTRSDVLEILDGIAKQKDLDWLLFSRGGTDNWRRSISENDLSTRLNEPLVLGMQRVLTRNGQVEFHLTYESSSETVPCDPLRKALDLPSCPSKVSHIDHAWIFEGLGAGHGQGLNIALAIAQAREGVSAQEILRRAFEP